MVSQLTRKAVLLGLAGGLAFSTMPMAKAQVEVTGGSISGDAAFFVPGQNAQGDIKLFDLAIQQLTIVSPNGVLTNPNFAPTGSYFNDNGDRKVGAGDTGLLRGQLSGIAFDSNGFIQPFSKVDTMLGFQVGLFNSALNVPGTLINPQQAAMLFLPGLRNVTLTGGTPATATEGDLQIGQFNANINNGLIDLPSTFKFQGGGASSIPEAIALRQKIKFEFAGNNVRAASTTPTNVTTANTSADAASASTPAPAAGSGLDLNHTDGNLRFTGPANQAFKVETVGNGNRKFEIQGTGAVDFYMGDIQAVGNVNETNRQNLQPGDPLNYKIDGQATGALALIGPSAVGFRGNNLQGDSPVSWNFTQNNPAGNYQFDGKFRGTVQFQALSGIGNEFPTTFGSNYQYSDQSSNPLYLSIRNVSRPEINVNNLTIGGFTINFTGGKLNLSNVDFTGATSAATNQVIIRQNELKKLIELFLDKVKISSFGNTANVSIFAFNGDSEVGQNSYTLLTSPVFAIRTIQPGRITVRFVHNKGKRYTIASRNTRGLGLALVGFQQIGPSSRAFPGLVGLTEISPEEAQSLLPPSDAAAPDATAPAPDATAPDATAPAPDATAPDATAPAPDATAPDATAPAVEGLEEVTPPSDAAAPAPDAAAPAPDATAPAPAAPAPAAPAPAAPAPDATAPAPQ